MRIPWYISYIHLYINISCFLIFFSVRFINWLKSSIMKFSPGQPSLILNRRLFEMNNMCILVTSAINWKRVFLQWIITLCQLFNAHYLRTAHVFLIKRQYHFLLNEHVKEKWRALTKEAKQIWKERKSLDIINQLTNLLDITFSRCWCTHCHYTRDRFIPFYP